MLQRHLWTGLQQIEKKELKRISVGFKGFPLPKIPHQRYLLYYLWNNGFQDANVIWRCVYFPN